MNKLCKVAAVIGIVAVCFCFKTNSADAYDFYGASIYDKEVPSSYMKYGIYDFKPTITEVTYGSPADKAGFKKGDIFLTINDMNAKRATDLDKITTNTITVNFFRGITRQTLTIDRLALEKEKMERIRSDKKAEDERNVTKYIARPNYSEERPDNSPPLKFDNATLEKKYGKSSYSPTNNSNYRITNQAQIPQSSPPLYFAPNSRSPGMSTGKCEIVFTKTGCSRFVADCPSGYALLEWYGGYSPSKGDMIAHDITSFGFKDIYYAYPATEGRVYVDDYLMSKTRAIEKFFNKCH